MALWRASVRWEDLPPKQRDELILGIFCVTFRNDRVTFAVRLFLLVKRHIW